MATKTLLPQDEINSLPVLWVRSMFDLQSIIHANLQKMTPFFIPYPLKQREEECFHELNDDYRNFVIDLISHWPKYTPLELFEKNQGKSDCDIVQEALDKQSVCRK